MTEIGAFFESPLVTWVKTFSAGKDELEFHDINDPVFLADVLTSIIERDVEKVKRQAKDHSARLQNWAVLINSIHKYYLDCLQQVVVIKVPDILNIVDKPTEDVSVSDLKQVLLLLLGCAVQCERKEHFINSIKALSVSCQKQLVDCIKQVTDDADNVVGVDTYGDSDDAKQLYSVVKKVVTERNELFQRLVTVKLERDFYENEVSVKKGELTAPPSLEKYQLLRDLQQYKAQTHQATIDIEEKTKLLCEVKEELGRKQQELGKLKVENLRLENDAKFAHSYRDELDNVKEKAMKSDKLEKEVTKLKEKVHEYEYFKARVEELKEDNSLLCECKENLEGQVDTLQQRVQSVMSDLSQLQQTQQQTQQEKVDLEKRLGDAMEENALLDFEKNRMKDGYTGPLRRMISYTSSEFLHGSQQQLSTTGHPISDELSESMTSHVTRLEVENDQLKHELAEIKAKLYNTQQEVEKLLKQSENDYKKRLQESEKDHRRQFQNIRREVSEELTQRFQSQKADLEAALNEKSDVVKKYQTRAGQFEKEKVVLAEQVKGLEDQLRCARHQRDELNSKVEKYKQELQQCNGRLRVCQDSQQSWDSIQGEKAGLLRELTCHKEQLHQDRKQLKKAQRENDDLLEQLKTQQEYWRRDKERCVMLQHEKDTAEMEREELRGNLDSVREASDQHIKQLEDQLYALQDKSVAVENLNDYLSNLSVMDDSVDTQQVYDTDLDAHLSMPPSPSCNSSFTSHSNGIVDSNHNNKNAKHSNGVGLQKRGDGNSRNSQRKKNSRSHTSTDVSGEETPPRISYVKRNGSSALPEHEKSGSQKFLSRLKSYVKSPKPDANNIHNQNHQHSSHHLQDVQMRHDSGAFVRNSRHRSTIHGHPLADTSRGLVKPEKCPSPATPTRPASSSFSRSHPLRQTMPERRATHRIADSPQHLHNPLAQSRDDSVAGSHSSYPRSHSNSISSRHDVSSDFDSGLEAPSLHNTSRQQESEESVQSHHVVSSIQIISTEIVEYYRKLSNGKPSEKLRQLVDKLLQLQGKYQSIADDNSKLRRLLESSNGPGSLSSLEKRTHELEAENRKLRLIVETLQNTLSGRNPYDDKEYHYFTNV